MKHLTIIVLILLGRCASAQVFWTEDFNNGCTSACPGVGYTSANGAWTETILGAQGTDPNTWFVSCAENNNGVGNCSSACSGGGNATMHISAALGNAFCPNDCGAAYDAGGLCGILSCPQTNRRIESPVINCSGKTSISLNYSFIHTGAAGSDFASVWYFNGTAWTNLGVVPQSNNTGCGGQGKWSSTTVALPASANNNPTVKIGFSWENNDDGAGTDPSVAVDDITLSTPSTTVSPITFSLVLPSSPVCQTTTINATYSSTSTPTSFTWSASSGNVVFSAVNSGTTNITFNASGTYTISLTACQGTNCATSSSTLQVIAAPVLSITASPTVICTPGSSTLSVIGPSIASYTWLASSGPNPSGTTSVVVTPSTNTTYSVIASVPGCTANASYNLPVSSPPTITVTPNANICTGQTINLTAGGAISYTWSPSGSLSSSTGAVVTATPATTTTYVVTGSDGVCTNTANVVVSVGASASVSISPTSTTICSGQAANLTASGGSTYTWTASSGSNPPGTANISVTPTANTTYTVLTGSGSCTASAVASVSVAAAMNLTVSPASSTLCSGTTETLIASGATSYTWSPSTGLSSTSNPTVIANPISSQTYIVTGSNGVCTSTASAIISVNSVTVNVNSSSSSYCIGASSLTLTASGASTYTWTPGAGLSSTNGATVTANPTVTTNYTVTGNNGGCISSNTITITVTSPGTLNITPSATLICSGGSSTLTANGASTYTWLPGFATTSTLVVNPSATSQYTVTGQSSSGCLASPAVVTISVSPPINPVIVSSSPSVCATKTINLSASASGSSLTYTWLPVASIQGANNTATIIAKPSSTNNVTYTVHVSNGLCIETATLTVQVFQCVPPVSSFVTLTNDSICTNGCVTFSATSTGSQPLSYQWLFPGGTPPSSNAINPQVCYFAKGDYTVGLITSNAYGSDTLIKSDFVNVADTPAVVIAYGDTLINVGQTAPISVTGGSTYHWTPDNGSVACPTCSATIAQPTVTTQYIAVAYNSPYCKNQDTILVRVDFVCGDFFVPNAFSPNDDGLNDFVKIHGFCIGTFNLQIFNRWGEKVFETTDKSVGWDGTYKGKPCDTGVFVYKADGITIDNKSFTIKGNITLIR